MKVLKEKISITIDSDIIEGIKKLAENDERSMSQYINLILRKHLDQKSKKKKNGIVRSCYFLVSEQESNQRSRHRGGTELIAPAIKAVPPLGPLPPALSDSTA